MKYISFESEFLQLANTYLPRDVQQTPGFKQFVKAVNQFSATREKKQLEHAFHINEIASKMLNEQINQEFKLKASTLEKLKDLVKNIDEKNQSDFDFGDDDPSRIAEFLKSEISKRKKSEERVLQMFTLLKTLLSNLPSGILVEDENKKILFVNEAFCTIFSLNNSSEQITGTDSFEAITQNLDLFYDTKAFEENMHLLNEKRKNSINDELQLTNGKIIERDFIPIFVENTYKGNLWQYRDVSESRKFKQQLIDISNIQDAILNGTDYSIIYTDREGIIQSFNKGAEQMLGYTADELVNKFTPSVFHDSQEVLKRSIELTHELKKEVSPGFEVFVIKAQNNAVDTNEWTYIHKNGSRKTVLLSVSSIKDNSGAVTGFLGVARDISKQKEAEEALKKSEENYRNIVEKSTNIIYKTNELGQFTYLNSVAERITGFKKQDLVDKHFLKLIRPDKREEALAFYNDQIKKDITSTYYEFPIITKSGEERWIGQNVQLAKGSTHLSEFTALAIDITERIHYERLMLLQKEKYQNIINNMNLGLLEVDKDERIRFANPGFSILSGYKNEELIGKKAIDLFVDKSFLNAVKNKIEQRLEGKSDMYELLVRNKSGEQRWWMVSGAPNYDNKGNVIGSIGIHLDITDQKKFELELALAKQKAEESARAKAAFLSNMSHEIRTPLNAIIGMIRELSRENLSEKQNTYVKNTFLASQHLLSILNNILDITKIEAEELQLDLHDFNLLKTLNDVKAIMLAKAAEKGLFLKLNQLENKAICVYGDSGRFRQILINLVGNAIKFTENGGITISYDVKIKQPGFKTVTITVTDTGIGMEASFEENLFKKFSQEDSSVSRKYGGSGLGMAITRELVSLMNGTIAVESKKGKGTTVLMTFLLPIGDATKLVDDTPIYLSSLEENMEILLVEDNEFNRLVAHDTLRRYKCSVTDAFNGSQAIDLLRKGRRFDVILMDLQMPVLNGFEATKIIRNELHLETPIIALTANAFKSELEECIKMGMNDYVTKPFEEDKLLNTIFKFSKTNFIVEQPEDSQEKDKKDQLFDLSKIKSMSRNDTTYVKKMVKIFIDQIEDALPKIKNFYLQNDLESLYHIAHRIKPSIDGMGIHSLHETIRLIEKKAKEKKNTPDLKAQILFLSHTLEQVILQLSQTEL